MSNRPGVCPNCGSNKITYNTDINNYYAGGNTDESGRTGYSAVCDSCKAHFVEYWKFDGSIIDHPSWLKEGSWIYDLNERWFAQVNNVSALTGVSILYITNDGADTRSTIKSVAYIKDYCEPVEVRCYSGSDLLRLLGYEIISHDGVSCTVDAVTKIKYKDGVTSFRVIVGNEQIECSDLLSYHHVNGFPCGFLVRIRGNEHEVYTAGYTGY